MSLLIDLPRTWWIVLLRGLLAVVFGILCFAYPNLTLLALVYLVGAYAILDGVVAFVLGLWAAGANGRAWPLLLLGVLGIAVGIFAFAQPEAMTAVILGFIAGWSIIRGVLEIASAVELRKAIDGEWLLGLSGVLAIAFGVLVVLFPSSGALAIVWLIGVYAILAGCTLLALAFRLKGLNGQMPARAAV